MSDSPAIAPLAHGRTPWGSRDLRQSLDLIGVLVEKELKLRYQGTVLGLLWSLANPLAIALVLHLAFRVVYKVAIENYPIFILSALFPWHWLSNSISAAPLLFFSNASLLKKLRFPVSSLCVAVVLADGVHFLAALPIFALFVLASGGHGVGATWWLGIPLLLVVQFALVLAAVLLLSTANVFFRDLDQLVRVALLLLFYLTPVVFPVSLLPDSLLWTLWLNPFGPLIVSWRSLLTENTLDPYLAIAAGQAALGLAFATWVFRRRAAELAELV